MRQEDAAKFKAGDGESFEGIQYGTPPAMSAGMEGLRKSSSTSMSTSGPVVKMPSGPKLPPRS